MVTVKKHFSNAGFDGCSDCDKRAPEMTQKELEFHRGLCIDCGEPVPVGGWPFCQSKANPAGHEKGTYGFKMSSVLAKKWERMS